MTKPKPSGENWHREGVGGKWNEMGRLQFEFLVGRGLSPDDYLLDIGCGSLRGGIHFISYLDTGHYYGIEKEPSLLEAGLDVEIPEANLEHKEPRLLLIDDFDLSPIPEEVQFDFALAQSVFTHLVPELIETCLKRTLPRLKPTGSFYATFWESEGEKFKYGKPHGWRKNERTNAKYPFSLFAELAERVGGSVEYVGDWGHPRNQKMLVFTRG